MKALNLTTLILLIVGGINWGLVGLFDFDLVATLFGEDTLVSNLVYVLVGASALVQIIPLIQAFRLGEVEAEAHPRAR